jgi:hypothetical protein
MSENGWAPVAELAILSALLSGLYALFTGAITF